MPDLPNIKRWSIVRDGVRGVLTVERVKGSRPADRPGWDLYEETDRIWALERFEPGADNKNAEKEEGERCPK